MSYESERKELNDWMKSETEKYFDESKKEMESGHYSRDSESNYQHIISIQKYNKKLLALKEKYNIK